VDVRIGRHVPATVTAMWHQRDVGGQAIGSALAEVGKRCFEEFEHDRIVKIRDRVADLRAGSVLRVSLADLFAAFGQALAGSNQTGPHSWNTSHANNADRSLQGLFSKL